MGGKHFYDSSSPAFDGQRCSSTWHYSRNIASWPVRCRPDKFFLSARPPPPPSLQVPCRPEPFRLHFFTAHYNLHSASKLLHPGQIISLEISLGSLLPLVVSRFTTPSFRFSTLRAKKNGSFSPRKIAMKMSTAEKNWLTYLFQIRNSNRSSHVFVRAPTLCTRSLQMSSLPCCCCCCWTVAWKIVGKSRKLSRFTTTRKTWAPIQLRNVWSRKFSRTFGARIFTRSRGVWS